MVENGSTGADSVDGLAVAQQQGRITVIRCDEPFNFSRLNNIAVRSNDGELLVFLNNDTTVQRPSGRHGLRVARADQTRAGAEPPAVVA